MAWIWMFENDDISKRLFISFIECAFRGRWVKNEVIYGEKRYSTIRALDGNNCFIDIVAPDGLRRSWHFNLGVNVTIDQSMLIFRAMDVTEELAVDDDVKLGIKKKPRSILDSNP